jgi:hypothetical protein
MFKAFWKKKKTEPPEHAKIILGMIMLKSKRTFEPVALIKDLQKSYHYNINEPARDSSATVLTIDEEMIAVTYLDIPIPYDDIEQTAQYAYNWQTAVDDLKDHQGHLIVSVMRGSTDQIKRFRIFTQVICSLLRTTDAIGVYKGNQSLLIPKEDYLAQAELMSTDYLPINLWIYFGFRKTDNGRGGYTYGLKEFDKQELEIVDSQKSLSEIREMLFNTAHYVLDYDVTFRDGQTLGVTEDEKIPILLSKGKFVDGDTFKLSF